MIQQDQKAVRFWDREVVDPSLESWMADERVRRSINTSISGSPHLWPLDWFVSYLAGRTFRRGLSIGCGTGGLERDLLTRGLCNEMDAFDGSAESIRIAREDAAKAGFDARIHYSIANFNEPDLPRHTYDVVFAHQSLHHVGKLEKLYSAVLHAMTPDALFYLDEYVGPSRHVWNDANFASYRDRYASLPESHRRIEVLPMPIAVPDPSEAIRSDEIVPELVHGFEILERRDYGGNLIAPMYPYVDRAEVEGILSAEHDLLRSGQPSFYTIIVARPKHGSARRRAHLRYFFVPKLKRIGRELRKIVGR